MGAQPFSQFSAFLHTMSVAFEKEAGVMCFLFVAWFFEKLVAMARGSVLIGNLLAGIILGPALLNIVPNYDSWRLIGKIGVLILVVDGSLQIDLQKVKQLGARALAAAAMGGESWKGKYVGRRSFWEGCV